MNRWLSCAITAALLAPSQIRAGSTVTASNAALATSSPYATQVGLNVMRGGGNAIDAAVAVSFALAVARPEAGNIGGGGVLTYYDAASGAVWTLDYRETAPAEAKPSIYLQADGNLSAAIRNGVRAAAVPATIAGLEAMHGRFGSRPWKELVTPAIALAREGVRVDGELSLMLEAARTARHIESNASTAAVFFPEKPLVAGTKLVQTDLAATLERIATAGPRDFYTGGLAERFVTATKAAGGLISFRDLRDYAPVWRAPLRIRFGDVDIFTAAPPSGGGMVIAETLNIAGGFDLAKSGFQTVPTLHLLAEAERRAWIDRNDHVADPATTRIPFRDLLSAERAAAWRASIKRTQATPTSSLSKPGSLVEKENTTHFTIIDKSGNVASVTTTLSENFGSGFVVPGMGFLLNNAMDDFTAGAAPNREGLKQAESNAIAAGRRPVSSLSPTIVLRNGKPWVALGSPGGPAIPTTILQVILNMTVWKKTLVDAIGAPRFHHQAFPDQIFFESDRAPRPTVDRLNAMGHGVAGFNAIGDVNAIAIEGGKITAVADPRHGGAAGGY